MKYMFDTNVQKIKYEVLKEVATLAFEDRIENDLLGVIDKIVPGPKATTRCCIYKEKAIVKDRIVLAMGGDKENENIVEVIPSACDECPITQLTVTEACRGCIAHHCMSNCPVGAVSIVNHKATIDHDKCIMCGKCLNSCQYTAIRKSLRPCEKACKVNAIKMGEDKKAKIDNDKCITCGACVYQCPFGAIMDKSFIMDTIKILKESQNNEKYKVYAVVAPSISGQFEGKLEKVVSGIKALGFYSVIEAALGADVVSYLESQELVEKGFLTSSCCPAFVKYIEKQFPTMVDKISHNLSPMAEISKHLKIMEPNCKVVFIGPCIGKKAERNKDKVKNLVDNVITFEELKALFDSRNLNLADLPEESLDNASYYGRIFARSGGLSEAVGEALREQGITEDKFKANPISCSGIEECKIALLKAKKGVLKENFIEGMACVDGCIGGPACLTHGPKDKLAVDKYGKEAMEKSISNAIEILNLKKIEN